MNGFRIVWPTLECGAIIYVIENSGKRMPIEKKKKREKGKERKNRTEIFTFDNIKYSLVMMVMMVMMLMMIIWNTKNT